MLRGTGKFMQKNFIVIFYFKQNLSYLFLCFLLYILFWWYCKCLVSLFFYSLNILVGKPWALSIWIPIYTFTFQKCSIIYLNKFSTPFFVLLLEFPLWNIFAFNSITPVLEFIAYLHTCPPFTWTISNGLCSSS